MDLDPAELEELAEFFARRLDPALERTPPPASPREEQRRAAAWLLVLEDAADDNKLTGLFARIRHRHRDDPALQEALDLLLEPKVGADAVVGGLFLLAMAAGFMLITTGIATGGALAWMSSRDVAHVQPHATVGQVMISTVETGPMQVPHRTERALPTGRCTDPQGGIVGYWYAGRQSPGQVGDTVHLARSINVRNAFPSADNGWNSGGRIRCVLRPGDQVRLSDQPIEVSGGAWWVPLHTGDLIP